MNDITVWEESLVPLAATQGDSESISATIVLTEQDTGVQVTETAPFVDEDGVMTADLTLSNIPVGVYDYYVTENFSTEPSLIYPDPNNCSDGECELPTITVCELPGSGSS